MVTNGFGSNKTHSAVLAVKPMMVILVEISIAAEMTRKKLDMATKKQYQ
jgi:hypothetical protein